MAKNALIFTDRGEAFYGAALCDEFAKANTTKTWRRALVRLWVSEGFLTAQGPSGIGFHPAYKVTTPEAVDSLRAISRDKGLAGAYINERKVPGGVDDGIPGGADYPREAAEPFQLEGPQLVLHEDPAAVVATNLERMVLVLEGFSERMVANDESHAAAFSAILTRQEQLEARLESLGVQLKVRPTLSASDIADGIVDGVQLAAESEVKKSNQDLVAELVQIKQAVQAATKQPHRVETTGLVSREDLVRELESHREKLLKTGPRASLEAEVSRLRETVAAVEKSLSTSNALGQMKMEIHDEPIMKLVSEVSGQLKTMESLRQNFESQVSTLGEFRDGARSFIEGVIARDADLSQCMQKLSNQDAQLAESVTKMHDVHVRDIQGINKLIGQIEDISEDINLLVKGVNAVNKISIRLEQAVAGVERVEEVALSVADLLGKYHALAKAIHESLVLAGIVPHMQDMPVPKSSLASLGMAPLVFTRADEKTQKKGASK